MRGLCKPSTWWYQPASLAPLTAEPIAEEAGPLFPLIVFEDPPLHTGQLNSKIRVWSVDDGAMHRQHCGYQWRRKQRGLAASSHMLGPTVGGHPVRVCLFSNIVQIIGLNCVE